MLRKRKARGFRVASQDRAQSTMKNNDCSITVKTFFIKQNPTSYETLYFYAQVDGRNKRRFININPSYYFYVIWKRGASDNF